MRLRYLWPVILLLSVALSGVAAAQTDSSSDRENLEWQRQVIEAAIAETRAELAAVKTVPVDPDVTLMTVPDDPDETLMLNGPQWWVVDRAAVELALQIFPLYQLASSDARWRLRIQIPTLVPALEAIDRVLRDGWTTLPELLEMKEPDRWSRISDLIAPGQELEVDTIRAGLAQGGLRAELSDLQGLLAAVDDELDGLRPLQPDLVDEPQDDTPVVDEDADDTPVVDEDADDTPVVDEPQEEPSDTATDGPGFAGNWTTRWGTRMELTGSGSSFKGPYGRSNKADENGVRTLGVIGEMDMRVTGERTLEGYWIKHSPSSVTCKSPKNGSDYWGQQLMVFDEAFMSWKGAWTYCDGSLWRDAGGKRVPDR